MRNVVASSLFSLLVLAVPAVASATETVAPAAEIAVPAAEPGTDFEHRAQLTLGIDGNDSGVGGRAGLRYLWFEAQLGGDTAIFDTRSFVGLKLMPMPTATFSPYAYGRLGAWESDTILGPHHEGTYRSAGFGVDLNVSRHVFLYGEGGVGEKDEKAASATTPEHPSTFAEVHLGLGFRF